MTSLEEFIDQFRLHCLPTTINISHKRKEINWYQILVNRSEIRTGYSQNKKREAYSTRLMHFFIVTLAMFSDAQLYFV